MRLGTTIHVVRRQLQQAISRPKKTVFWLAPLPNRLILSSLFNLWQVCSHAAKGEPGANQRTVAFAWKPSYNCRASHSGGRDGGDGDRKRYTWSTLLPAATTWYIIFFFPPFSTFNRTSTCSFKPEWLESGALTSQIKPRGIHLNIYILVVCKIIKKYRAM